MNGQIMIEGFTESEETVKALMKTLGRAIDQYEEACNHLAMCEPGHEKRMLQLITADLRESIIECFDDVLDCIVERDEAFQTISEKMKTAVADGSGGGVRAFFNALRQYMNGGYDALANMPDDEKIEILSGLNESNETGIAYCEDHPLIKALLKRTGAKEATKITVLSRNDLVVKQGAMMMYQKELFDNIMKAKREGKVTKSGWIYFTTGQLNKWISGGAKFSPSKEQNEYNQKMLTELGNNRIEYMTERSLADLLGLESGEDIPGFKFTGGVNAQFYEVKFYSGTEFKGQLCKDSLLVTVKLNDEIEKLLDGLNWYEPMREDVKRVQYIAQTGELKNWPLTKERITLRTCLIGFVCSYLRARTPTPGSPAKPYSNKLPYSQIFSLCDIETNHATKRKRKIEDIAIIMDHLQREGMITSWKEYTNRGSKKPDGVQIFVAKELLAAEGG